MWTKLVWPIFWLLMVWVFKDEIKSLLAAIITIGNKAKKISYMGANVDLGSNADLPIGSQQQLEAKQQNLSKAYQSSIITVEENTIRTQLIEAGFTNEQAINLLIYHIANQNLLIKLLFIDKLIFQEQIKLISYLNSQVKPQSESALKKYYDEWKEKNKDADYTYQQFLKFLSDQRLVVEQVDGYSILPLGKEYLYFLIKLGRPIS